jgi:vacuolar-type H+-ATPase subunit E/Vma4
MGESELKKALKDEGEERIRSSWQAVEEVVTKRRQELEAEREQLRIEIDRQLQGESSRQRNKLLAEARSRTMACQLRAEAELEERMRELATQLLTELVAENRDSLWLALCAELPQANWGEITVSTADRALAIRNFPSVEIQTDEALAGGLIATSRDGGLRVDNSLECRLLRAWPDLLPQLMSELRKRVDEDETA